jgi:hypothetical protein
MDAAFYKPRPKVDDDLGPLFAPVIPEAPPVAVADHQTSREAADKVVAIAGALRQEVLSAVVRAGVEGLTDKELEALEQFAERRLAPSTLRKRRSELFRSGFVRPRGIDRREGCTVWVSVRHL